MGNKRDSFIFYRSFFEAINDLIAEDRYILYDAICKYCLNFEEPILTGLNATLWKLIKPQLDANNKRFNDGKKGGRPKKKTSGYEKEKTSGYEKEKTSGYEKEKPNNNVNDNDNDNVNEKETKKNYVDSLDECADFKECLLEWLQYLKKLKLKRQWEYQYNNLKSFTNYRDVVDFSINKGYQGLYEPKQSQVKKELNIEDGYSL